MSSEGGLRERKKQLTRQRIADTAMELFADRGFDGVRVAEVAHAAEVSEATVFNYFRTKEDLVYRRMEEFHVRLLAAVRARPEGASVLSAFRDCVLAPHGVLAAHDPAVIERIATFARIIAGSATLQTREHQVLDGYTRDLAKMIAEERRAPAHDLRPWVTANALMGVQRALTEAVRRHALQGHSGRTIARDVRTQGGRAFALLEQGLSA